MTTSAAVRIATSFRRATTRKSSAPSTAIIIELPDSPGSSSRASEQDLPPARTLRSSTGLRAGTGGCHSDNGDHPGTAAAWDPPSPGAGGPGRAIGGRRPRCSGAAAFAVSHWPLWTVTGVPHAILLLLAALKLQFAVAILVASFYFC